MWRLGTCRPPGLFLPRDQRSIIYFQIHLEHRQEQFPAEDGAELQCEISWRSHGQSILKPLIRSIIDFFKKLFLLSFILVQPFICTISVAVIKFANRTHSFWKQEDWTNSDRKELYCLKATCVLNSHSQRSFLFAFPRHKQILVLYNSKFLCNIFSSSN